MKLNNPKITLLVGQDFTTIEVMDSESRITFIDIKLTAAQLSQALSRLGYVDCECKLRGIENVGKKKERKDFTFEIPDSYSMYAKGGADNIKELGRQKVQESGLSKDNWVSDDYYGSQNSFFHKDGKKYARVSLNRWVNAND